MKNFALIIGIFVFAFLGIGCSSKQDIEGETFIDLGGRGASKLALVDIQIVPEDKFIAHIKNKLPKAAEEAAKLKASIADFEVLDARGQALIQQSRSLQMQSSMMASTGGMLAEAAIGAARNSGEVSSLAAQLDESRKRAQKHSKDLDGLSSGANNLYFSEKIDGAVLTTASNVDGKFKLSLESGKKVVLVAAKEGFGWALWITPDKSKPTITLSNKNLSGSSCDDCVFNGKVTPKSLTGS